MTSRKTSPQPWEPVGSISVDDGGGSLTVDGSLSISGTVPVTQSGTWNLTNISGTVSLPTGAATSAKQDTGNTSLSSIDTRVATTNTRIGSTTDSAPAADTDTASLNGRLQRVAKNLTTINTTLGTPFQAGGSIGNTAFSVNNGSGASAVNIQDGGNSITVDGTAFPITATTTGGCSAHHVISAASTNATNVKSSAGQVYSVIIRNTSGVVRKVAFHNTSGTPTAGAGIYFVIILNNTAAPVTYTWPVGVEFSSGIGYTMVTGTADSDATAVGANELYMELFYK